MRGSSGEFKTDHNCDYGFYPDANCDIAAPMVGLCYDYYSTDDNFDEAEWILDMGDLINNVQGNI